MGVRTPVVGNITMTPALPGDHLPFSRGGGVQLFSWFERPPGRRRRRKSLPGVVARSGFVLFGLFAASVVSAGDVEEDLKRGEELYQTHHLSPDRMDRAIALYERALAQRPNDYGILWKLSDMHQNYGESLGEEEKQRKIALWEKGTVYGRRAVEADPNGREGHFFYMANMGASARIRGAWTSLWKFRKIKRELDRTLELDPNYPLALVARAQYLTEMPAIFGGDEDEAVRLYERAIDLDPGLIVVTYYLARLDAEHERYEQAMEKLDKVFQCRDPWNQGHYVKIVLPWAESLREEVSASSRRE